MKSVILCEGKDDLWFIGYYLSKTKAWKKASPNQMQSQWSNYKIKATDQRQDVLYMIKAEDSLAIWAVGGKDRLKSSMQSVQKINDDYPMDTIGTVVMIRDCDDENLDEIISGMSLWFGGETTLQNHVATVITREIDGLMVDLSVLPIVIPFDEAGAIETLLCSAFAQCGDEEQYIVGKAKGFVRECLGSGRITNYLTHARLVTKAEYSSVVAITNPDHSTALFQDMILACPWEQAQEVQRHYDPMADAVEGKAIP